MKGTVRKCDVFFSYNWRDREAVEVIASTLREQSLTVFLDRWYLVPGRPWPQALEEALKTCQAVSVFLGPHGMGRWQQREKDLALNRQARDSTFPVIPVLLPGADPALGFLSLNTWVDLRAGIDDPLAIKLLAAAVRGQPPGPELQEQMNATLATVCPYRGLRFFREEDAPFFFGREAFTAKLAEEVTRHTMIAVVGASGCGKSSVVRAGLVPYLRKGVDEQVWDIATLVPGDRPLHALAAALVPVLEPEMTETNRLAEIGKLAGHFAEKSVALRDVVARILEKQPGTDHLLLVVDQWEELYTLVHDDQIRQRFVDELLEATAGGTLTVVLTLRGDFFGRVLSHRALADRLQNAIVNLGPMTREELGHAIEAPAQKIGLTFEPGLVGRILDDVEEEPGSLPLLEFVLTGLWESRRAGMLLHEAYEAMGEVQGAMTRRADEVFGKLSPVEQNLVRRVLVQLVRPGEGTEDTRRRATFTEVGEAARPVVRQLADARLTVTGHDEATGEETVEVAHEALIHNWTRLRGWLDEDREFLLWRQRLRANLEEWERTEHEKGTLLRGAPLTEAEHWLIERADDISPTERDFIENSAAWREQERIARERLRKRIVTGLIAGLLVAIVLAALAVWQWNRAEKAKAEAEQQRKAAEQNLASFCRNAAAQLQDRDDYAGALLWYARALTLESRPEHARNDRTAAGMIVRAAAYPRFVVSSDRSISRLAAPSDGRYLIVSLYGGGSEIVDAASGRRVGAPIAHDPNQSGGAFPDLGIYAILHGEQTGAAATSFLDLDTREPLPIEIPHPVGVSSLDFSRDGALVIITYWDRTLRVWRAADAQLVFGPVELPPDVKDIRIDDTGTFLAVAGGDLNKRDVGGIELWRLSGGGDKPRYLDHHAYPWTIGFTPDGSLLLANDSAGRIHFWDTATGRPVREPLVAESRFYQPRLDRAGRRFVVGTDGQSAYIYNVADASIHIQTPRYIPERIDDEVWVKGVAFSPDELRFCSSSLSQTCVWNSELVRNYPRHPYAVSVPISHYGLLSDSQAEAIWVGNNDVAMLTCDGQATVWRIRNHSLRHDIQADEDWINGVAFSPDGSLFAAVSRRGFLKVWRLVDGRLMHEMDEYTAALTRVRFGPDGKCLLTIGGDAAAQVWRLDRKQPIATLQHEDRVVTAEFSPDGERILTASRTGAARMWAATTGEALTPPMAHEGGRYAAGARFSRDGHLVATAYWDGTLRIWDAHTGELAMPEVQAGSKRIHDFAFSPDGHHLAVGGTDSTVQVYAVSPDAIERQPGLQLSRYAEKVAFDAEGERLLVEEPGSSGGMRVWDVARGAPITPFMNHGIMGVYDAAISRDGSRVVTWTGKTAIVWNVASGRAMGPPLRYHGYITSVALSPDGNSLVCGYRDGRVHVWDLRPISVPVDDLKIVAEVLSSRRFDVSGALVPLEGNEMSERMEALRTRYPALFPAEGARRKRGQATLW